MRASLPLQTGVILDPFAGSGSTLAAANHIGHQSIGVEIDSRYVEPAAAALPALGAVRCPDTPGSGEASRCRACRG